MTGDWNEQWPVTLVVLAGGRGSRMNGRDKGLIELNGVPLVAHLIGQFADHVAQVLINANRSHEQYRGFGHPLVRDDLSDYQGPLAGFHAALGQIHTDDALFVPCDSPCLSLELLRRLWATREQEGTRIAVAHDGKRMQPVCALVPKALRDDLADYLEGGDRKIDLWYARQPVSVVDFADQPELFNNINSPQDLAALSELWNNPEPAL